MNEEEERKFYDKIGEIIGWDFSKIQCEMIDNSDFQYFDEINKRAKDKIILDIGTGGGEKVLREIKNAKLIIGTDFSKNMIEVAKQNAKNRNGVKFFYMDSNNLNFPERFF